MKEGYWVIRTYIAGNVGEKIKYWIEGERPTKSDRRLKSDIKKIQQNEASSTKNVARLFNANFTPVDYLIGLDYSEEAYNLILKIIESRGVVLSELTEEELSIAIREEAERDFSNWIKRCKNAALKGTVFKYVGVTSDMNGKTGELVRIHHHIVISGNMKDICLNKWTNGTTHCEHIWDEPDHLALADYLISQVRHVPDAKKYKSSRNLIRPIPKDKIAIGGAELRLPKHCALLYRGEYKPGMPQYIRYILPPKPLVIMDKLKSENENYDNGSGIIWPADRRDKNEPK
jgi:hypothetical protein